MKPILDQLARRPAGETAIRHGARTLSAGQLLADVERMRTALASGHINRPGVLAANSPAWIAADLAGQSADRCLLPMPTFFSDGQLAHCVRSAGINAVLTDDPDRVRRIFPGTSVTGRETDGLTWLRLPLTESTPLPPQTRKITFTSGSTGEPRGVCLGLEQQLRVARALETVLDIEHPRHLCLLPLSTLLENICGIYYPLLAGGAVILPAEAIGAAGPDTLAILGALERHRPTSVILLPQMLVGLVAALEDGWRPPAELEFAAVGGAKVAVSLLRRARELGLPAYEGYGLSETGSVACLNLPGNDRIGSVGRPLPHAAVRCDAGEILIDGNGFLGYVDDPDSWHEATVRTGDLGTQDPDGYVYLHGRRKNLLITSVGRNISPEWVESELLQDRRIGQCIVFGDDRPYCTALIAPTDPAAGDADIQAGIDAANRRLPDYAQIRRWFRLPRSLDTADGMMTDNGRPRREAIARRFGPIVESLYSGLARIEPERSLPR